MTGLWSWIWLLVVMTSMIPTSKCVSLSYGNCAEVEAENPAVIEGIANDFFCNCDLTEDSNCKGYQSCFKLLEAGFQQTGYYEIDPDGPDTGVDGFLVFCDMCVAITSTTPTVTVEPAGCRDGYSSFQSSCYKIYSTTMNKDAAAAACTGGSHLVDITTQEEQDFLARMLSDAGSGDLWLGLTASGYNEPMFWSDGSPVVFTAWSPAGRNSGGTCVRMNDQYNYEWGDISCGSSYGYLCEYEVSDPVSVTESDDCQGPLGVEDGRVTDAQLSASTIYNAVTYPVTNARLNRPAGGNGDAGSWSAASNTYNEWVQVDLLIPTWVSGVMLQGRDDQSQWVKKYKVEYTTDVVNWMFVMNNANEELVFTGNNDRSTVVTSTFPSPVSAKLIKIHITEYHSWISMRFELIGSCSVVSTTQPPSTTASTIYEDCKGTTVIDHEQSRTAELETKNKPGEIVVPITYKPSIEQMSALLTLSESCQQYIQYDCQNSRIWGDDGWPYVWWKSRHGKDMHNFGGIPTGEEGCAGSPQSDNSGGQDDCTDTVLLGMADGRITNSQLSASTIYTSSYPASNARINRPAGSYGNAGSWSPKTNNLNEWVQVDLLVPTWVSGVMLQGRAERSQWVKKYKVEYSSDGVNWMFVTNDANQEMLFTGNTNQHTVVTAMFPSRVSAKLIKIRPKEWSSWISMRFELIGSCIVQVSAAPEKNCNCDLLDGDWYRDDGFLTDRGQLPVTTLRFGGNDASKYTLGPLECNGTNAIPKRSCAELWSEGVRRDMEYEIDPDGPGGIGPTFKVFCNLSEAAPILRSCDELRVVGYKTNGYYDIDPDGPRFGEAPFTVLCNQNQSIFENGYTVIDHDSELTGRVKGYKDTGSFVLSPNYMVTSAEQMYNLIGVSESCKQYIQYDCFNSKMYKGDERDDAEAWWATADNAKMVNWGGVETGNHGCSCFTNNACTNTDKVCNCDVDNDDTWKKDGGWLTDKDTLPVMKVYLAHTETSQRSGWHTLGPLYCTGSNNTLPTYRTCTELFGAGYERNGYYLLDSDGPNIGDKPYVAYCDLENNGVTILNHDQPNSINMKEPSGVSITVDYSTSVSHLKSLASLSASCRQHLKLSCTKFPIWNGNLLNGWWVNINGQKMNTWGGAAVEKVGCACAENGDCHSPSEQCNCDTNDENARVDEGWITDKLILPVTELHFNGIDDISSVGIVTLGPLECEGTDVPLLRTCDEYMNAGFGSGWYNIDPDGPEGTVSSFSVYCDTNTGATVIHHDIEERRLAKSELGSPEHDSFRRIVNYKATNDQILALMEVSLGCRQFISWECHSSFLSDGYTYWMSRDGQQMVNWGGVQTGVEGCACHLDDSCAGSGQLCNCDSNDDNWRTDEGFLTDKSKLPVSELRMGDINDVYDYGFYTLGPLECGKKGSSIPVLQSCSHLQEAGYTNDGYYDIDPDGSANGGDPFAVYCDMFTGSTVIAHNRETRGLVKDTPFLDIIVEYVATLDQIRALIDISTNCQQYMSYECRFSGLFGATNNHIAYWKHGNDEKHYNFAGVDSGLQGCPCSFDDSCGKPGRLCTCLDGSFNGWKNDTGLLTNKNQLPVVTMRFGDTNDIREKGFYTLGKLECNNRVFTSCIELKEAGYLTDGYYTLSYPNGTEISELVFCKMTEQGSCSLYRTDPYFRYQYRFPELPEYVTSIEFSVKAESNVFIALSPEPEMRTNDYALYEIAIRSEGIDKAEIRKCIQNCLKSNWPTVGLLNETAHVDFYINFANGLIQVGHVGKSPFASYSDPSPLSVKYVAFSTGFGSEGEWRFHDYLCNGFRKYCILVQSTRSIFWCLKRICFVQDRVRLGQARASV